MKKRVKKINILDKRKLISLIEILLLISLSFTIPILYSNSTINLGENKFTRKIINFFDLIPSVSAQAPGGLNINSVLPSSESGQAGCCFDNNEGLCSPNSEKTECEAEDDGRFYGLSSCNINQCILGCCILGTESQFVTQTRCNKLGDLTGLPATFNSGVTDEYACIGLSNTQDVGACVILSQDEYEKNSCKFTNKEDCNKLGGDFHKDLLCSNPDLNTVCEKQKSASCVNGKDGLYWIDSCGNRENIYDSDKTRSWNNGKVLSEKESCSPTSSNSRSTSCGNCGYDRGSICAAYRPGIDKGNMQGNTCRDLDCKDGLRTRKNGESWCLYDGQVGNGRDVVGSRHFRRLCINGELKTEPCADYRKEICVRDGGAGGAFKDTTNEILGKFGVSIPDMSSIPGLSGLLGGSGLGGLGGGSGGLTGFAVSNETGNDSGGILDNFGGGEIINKLTGSSVICRPNLGGDCAGRNIGTCSQNPDCKTKIVYVDDDFYLLKCVPKYPLGSELRGGLSSIASGVGSQVTDQTSGGGQGAIGNIGGLGGSNSGGICEQGSGTCVVVYEKKCPGGWKCVKNCDCEKMSFTIQMNELCLMQGDCGAYTNIAGKVTSNGYSLSKKGGRAKTPPKLIGVDKVYSVFAKGGSLSEITGGVDGGFYNEIPKLDLTPTFGVDIFGSKQISANDDQLGNMFSGSNVGGIVGTAGVAGVGAGVGVASIGGAALPAGGIAGGTSLAGGSTLVMTPGSSVLLSTGETLTASAGGGLTATGGAVSSATAGINIPLGAEGLSGAITVAPAAAAEGATSVTLASTTTATTVGAEGAATGGSAAGGGAGAGGATGAGGGTLLGLGPLAWAGIAIAAVVILYYALGCGKQEQTEITFTCKPGNPPAIGDCSFCGKDPAKPCSRYRCESLGQNCKLINENTGQDECVTINLAQGTPKITPYQDVLNKTLYQYTDVSNNGFKIRTKDGDCLPAFTPLVFGVKTNIPAYCRISGDNINSSGNEDIRSFGGDFLEGEIYTENHTTTTYLPSVDSVIGGESNNFQEFSNSATNNSLYDYLLDKTGDINLHVKCQSAGGQENEQDYRINFCVKPGPDLTPPVVLATAPPNGAYVANIMTGWIAIFFINEPVDCRWGTTKPSATNLLESYNSLTNSMLCEKQSSSGSLIGYPCNTGLPLTQNENKYYIQCRDQPWLEENTSRNIGSVFEYTLKKTETSLVIESLTPNETIMRGVEPTSVEIKVQTVGGLNSGESICQYALNGNNNYITFANTKSNQHTQILNLVKGTYNVNVKCVDAAGNIANSNSEFTLELDTKFPEVTRVFYSSGSLVVITDESSKCYYRNDSTPQCNYNYENATEMVGGEGFIHQTSWDKETTYYIKCKDVWENSAGGCSLVAKPYEITSY